MMNEKNIRSKLIRDELIALLKQCKKDPLTGLTAKVLAKRLGSYPERITYHLIKLKEKGKVRSSLNTLSKNSRKPLIWYVK